MTERLLQYIWQFQYYNRNDLVTVDGDPLLVVHPGHLNTNQGPDFFDAKVMVGDTLWAGSIELHIRSSQWNGHGHGSDKNYSNVVLHVVWQDDLTSPARFPVLELQTKVSKLLLARFDDLMNTPASIPCSRLLANVPVLVWQAWKERLVVERLQLKTARILALLDENRYHWEEAFWWLLARNFGIRVNCDAFERMARSLPVNILAKHKNQIHQAEALLFGQAGLLEKRFTEDYPRMLQKEYRFYRKKYKLQPVHLPLHFLRMRPSNFPTVRLAQLAMLVHRSAHLFSVLKETSELADARRLLNVTANDYWHYHYCFDEPSSYREKNLGAQMIDSILINTIAPILFAYGHFHKDAELKERSVGWLQSLAAEKNHITRGFVSLGVGIENAFDSQALIRLKTEYCDPRRCLECSIGTALLKPPV